MADMSAARAINQDSCERWWLCHEYCRRWTPGFDQRMKLEEIMRKQMRDAVREINDTGRVYRGQEEEVDANRGHEGKS